MTSPVKQKSLSNISEREPEVSFGVQHGAIPKSQIERRAAQACKQFRAAFVPDLSHLDNSTLSFAGSVNQHAEDWGMETFRTLRKTTEPNARLRDRWQENLSLFLRRKAGTGRGFTGWLADLWECSTSKASKVMYGDANPHWTDFLILYQEFGPEIIDAVIGDDTADLARRKHTLRKLLELIEAEGE